MSTVCPLLFFFVFNDSIALLFLSGIFPVHGLVTTSQSDRRDTVMFSPVALHLPGHSAPTLPCYPAHSHVAAAQSTILGCGIHRRSEGTAWAACLPLWYIRIQS